MPEHHESEFSLPRQSGLEGSGYWEKGTREKGAWIILLFFFWKYISGWINYSIIPSYTYENAESWWVIYIYTHMYMYMYRYVIRNSLM